MILLLQESEGLEEEDTHGDLLESIESLHNNASQQEEVMSLGNSIKINLINFHPCKPVPIFGHSCPKLVVILRSPY